MRKNMIKKLLRAYNTAGELILLILVQQLDNGILHFAKCFVLPEIL